MNNNLDTLTTISKPGFIEHVFQFNDSSKAETFNIVQYATLALIPVVLLNKSIAKWIPEASTNKGSAEIAVEVLSQTTVMFLGMMFIHRIITFVPTYSKIPYEEFHPTSIVLAVLMIVLSLQTNLGEKIAILTDRAIDLWEGKPKPTKKKDNQGGGVGEQQGGGQSMTGVSPLPPPQPNYDNMYQQGRPPLVGGQTPGGDAFAPSAANDINDINSAFGTALGSTW